MKNNGIGFLENLFQGTFLHGPDFPGAPAVDTERVDAFMERFKSAVSGFEAQKIEGMHVVPPPLLERLKEIGMFGLIIGREHGGMGFGLHEYLAVIQRMSESDMALALIPLAHLSIGVMGVILFGTDEQKLRYLPKAASGETIFAYALTEPDTGSDAQHVKTCALPAEDGGFYILNGTKTYITNANYAGAFSAFAQLDPQKPGRMGMFIVERGWDGVTVGSDMPKMGLSVSSTASVRFSGVRVPKENLVGGPGDGFKIAMTILNYGRLLSASLRDMSRRSRTRAQFGSPIREFELIQEKLVHARVHGLAASAMTSFTAELLARDPLSNVALESSHCKLYGTTRCWDTLYDAQQTAGGSGYLSTLPYEKRLRDFRVTTIFEGTTEIHSIYPPLALFRFFGKRMEGLGAAGRLAMLRRVAGGRALRRGAGAE
jgi:acyl-CoA dehydrogenase family protein 9